MARYLDPVQLQKATKKRTATAAFLMFVLIPVTIWIGTYFGDNRKYLLISFLILFETMAPFFMVFEHRRPRAREIVMIAMLAALTVVGNLLSFSVLPIQMGTAMVIISGVSFGPEAGFLVGALARLICNFFQGQGMWTPWQMFCWGLLGFLAGLLFQKQNTNVPSFKRGIPVNDFTLTLFTFITVFIFYGGIMNVCTLVTGASIPGGNELSISAMKAIIISGIPFDLMHAFRASFFMLIVGRKMVEKLERVKIKYGFYRS